MHGKWTQEDVDEPAWLPLLLDVHFDLGSSAANMLVLAVLTKFAVTIITVVLDACLIAASSNHMSGVGLHPVVSVVAIMLTIVERTAAVIVIQADTPCTPRGCFCE